MEIRRTANAGVLLKLDGVSILLDGVCREVKPYLATPVWEREALSSCWPDLVAFTHEHADHYDPDYAAAYQRQSGGVILGPVSPLGCNVSLSPVTIKGITVTVVPSRHIGAAYQDAEHVSYIVHGSRCVWFTGDASPLQWKDRPDLPRPDVLIAPYAYAATATALRQVCQLGAKMLVLLHLPNREEDPYDLWDAVESAVKQQKDLQVYIPAVGQVQNLPAFP